MTSRHSMKRPSDHINARKYDQSCSVKKVKGTLQEITNGCEAHLNETGCNGTTNGHVNNTTNDVLKHDNEVVSFLERMFEEVIRKGLEAQTDKSGKVVEFKHPSEIKQLIDLELRKTGLSDQKLFKICEPIVKYSVKTGHPHFFNQLFQGLDRYALAGMWLTDTLNTSQYTFEVAPVFTMMEDALFRKLRSYVGWDEGDGIFCPGGSVSNMYAMNLARFRKYPDVKSEGMHCIPKIRAFTSEYARCCKAQPRQTKGGHNQSQGVYRVFVNADRGLFIAKCHFSFTKASCFLGIGAKNLIPVKCDSKGRMMPSELEKEILRAKQEGYEPFFVNNTSGTTVFGAYDQINDIADICEKYKIWLHVDACWGGGALLSKQHRHKLEGIQRADSVAWNPQKMMGSLVQACTFLTKHENILKEAHSANASYLFQQDKVYDVTHDTGDKSIQCGRKVDVLKVWLMWKARGDEGLEARIDHIFDCTRHLAEKVKRTDGFKLVLEPECSNVCFWYVPPSLRGQEETDEWREKLAQVAPTIKGRMQQSGSMLIGQQPQGEHVNFFRFVLCNADVTFEDMDFVVDEIERMGSDL